MDKLILIWNIYFLVIDKVEKNIFLSSCDSQWTVAKGIEPALGYYLVHVPSPFLILHIIRKINFKKRTFWLVQKTFLVCKFLKISKF